MKPVTTMYEKHNWVNGEVITEDKLNHMEDGIATGGGIYSVSETYLFNGEVTATENEGFYVGEFTTTKPLAESDLKVIFNGKEYLLPYDSDNGFYGEAGETGPSFENYPLYIEGSDGMYAITTPEAGTYSLQIPGETELVVSNELANGIVMSLKEETHDDNKIYLDKTFAEINEAFLNGKIVFVQTDTDRYYLLKTFTESSLNVLKFIMDAEQEQASDQPFKKVTYSANNEDGYPMLSSIK